MSRPLIKNWLAAAWVAGAIFAALGLLIYTYFALRNQMRLTITHYNFKEIGMALHQYHDRYESFPPVIVRDEHQLPQHSWRALIQPELARIAETSDEYAAYDFSQPWHSPENLAVMSRHRFGRHGYEFLAVVGPHAAWTTDQPRTRADIKDGTMMTVLAIALRNTGTTWNEPRDLDFDGENLLLNDRPVELGGALYLLMADGSVRYCAEGIPWETLRPMLTIDGGEKVDW